MTSSVPIGTDKSKMLSYVYLNYLHTEAMEIQQYFLNWTTNYDINFIVMLKAEQKRTIHTFIIIFGMTPTIIGNVERVLKHKAITKMVFFSIIDKLVSLRLTTSLYITFCL